MFRTALGSVLLLVVVNVVATSAPPYDNSICMAHGDWTCLEQGTRICNWNRPTCGGSCYVCFGNDTIPPKMCFMNEGGQCQPVDDYVCSTYSFQDATCVKKADGSCRCDKNLITKDDPACKFSSCN